MEKLVNNFTVNLGLLLSGIATVFSGLLIQVNYHMGQHGNIDINNEIYGISYNGWSDFHKISIVLLSALMIVHIYRHWKWYTTVIRKKLKTKNRQVITLSALFLLVAVTGFTPWFIDLLKGDVLLRKLFIEIHDKLAILLSVYLILHIIKRLRWFFTTFSKIRNLRNAR